MPAEPIEELAVRIVANTDDLLEETDEAIKTVFDDLDEFSEELTAKLNETFGEFGEAGKLAMEEVMKQVPNLMAVSSSAEDFRQRLWALIEAQKKNVSQFKKQTKEGRETGSMFSNLAKKLLVGLGIYTAVRRAWVAFTRIFKDAIKLIIEAGDQTSPLIMRLRELEQETTGAKLAIGAMILPIKVMGEELKVTFVKFITVATWHITQFVSKVVPTIAASLAALQSIIADMLENIRLLREEGANLLLPPGLVQAVHGKDAIKSEWKDITEMMETAREKYEETLEDMTRATEEWRKNLFGAMASIVDLIKARLITQLDELKKDFQDRIKDISQSTIERLEDITTRFMRRRIDAEIDLIRDLQDIDRDAADNRISALLDYQLREFRIREDFKMRLLDLENRYILDLEDAVRERDARAVLMLQRRFNLEKAKMNAEKNLRIKRMKEDFQLELAEIERQRRIRKMQRLLEFEQEMQDLAIQEERAREDARLAALRRIHDLEESMRRRLKTLAEAFVDEYTLTAEQLRRLYDLLASYYGPEGYIEKLFEYIASVAAQVPLVPKGPETPADKTPESQDNKYLDWLREQRRRLNDPILGLSASDVSSASGSPRTGFGGAGSAGRMQLDLNVLADERLVVEVVDEAMNQVADVFVQVNRAGRGGK